MKKNQVNLNSRMITESIKRNISRYLTEAGASVNSLYKEIMSNPKIKEIVMSNIQTDIREDYVIEDMVSQMDGGSLFGITFGACISRGAEEKLAKMLYDTKVNGGEMMTPAKKEVNPVVSEAFEFIKSNPSMLAFAREMKTMWLIRESRKAKGIKSSPKDFWYSNKWGTGLNYCYEIQKLLSRNRFRNNSYTTISDDEAVAVGKMIIKDKTIQEMSHEEFEEYWESMRNNHNS